MLVEDSEDDLVLFELALRRADLRESFPLVRRFPTGEEAIAFFLKISNPLELGELPDILVLDLKLPGCSGFEVLARLKSLKSRPVTGMFTTSILPEDKQRAEELGVDLFETKTFEAAGFSRFLHFLARIADGRRRDKLSGVDSL